MLYSCNLYTDSTGAPGLVCVVAGIFESNGHMFSGLTRDIKGDSAIYHLFRECPSVAGCIFFLW